MTDLMAFGIASFRCSEALSVLIIRSTSQGYGVLAITPRVKPLTHGMAGSRRALRTYEPDPWSSDPDPATLASAASATGRQNVIAMVRYSAMAVDSSARACSGWFT
jgi:hypothetical protein